MRTPQNSTRYDSTTAMRILIAVAFLFARFPCFFHCLLGLINRSNPYVLRRSYLIRVSYKEYESKTRGKGVNNKNLSVRRRLTPFLTVPILHCRFRTVMSVLKRYTHHNALIDVQKLILEFASMFKIEPKILEARIELATSAV